MMAEYEDWKNGEEARYRYFDRDKFIPRQLADDIMESHSFRTLDDTEELLHYDKGAYHENGEGIVKTQVAELLGEELSRHRTSEVLHDIKSRTLTNRSEFDKKTNFICLKKGILNLDTMKVRQHNPNQLFTTQIPIKHDKNADCPLVKKFISEIVNEKDVQVVQELLGYCLLRDYHIQKAFMLVGSGANGKSTLLRLIKAFLGSENVASVSLQDLNTQRFTKANLYGKLANLFADLPDKALAYTGVFKMLVGGDPITTEKKFKHHFSFVNYAKLIFSANKIPETKDETDAYYRRWVIINFPNTFEGEEADTHLDEKLNEELPGVLNWALEGLKRLQNNSNFTNTETTSQVRDTYDRMSSPLKAFISDRVTQDGEARISKDKFYSKYAEYCKENNLPVKAKNVIGRELPAHLPYVTTAKPKIGNERVSVWAGIRLENKEDQQGGLETYVEDG